MNTYRTSAGVAAAVILAGVVVGLGRRLVRSGGSAPLRLARCPIHGITYDSDLEVCPSCTKPAAPDGHGNGGAR